MDEDLRGYEAHRPPRDALAERLRVLTITSLGRTWGRRDVADEAILRGWPVAEAEREFLRAVRPAPLGDIALSSRELRQFSVLRWLSAARDPAAARRTFEGEASRAVAKALGREADDDARRLFVPPQVLSRDLQAVGSAAALTSGTGVVGFSGGLHAAQRLRQLGAAYVGPLTGTATLPAFASSSTAQWLTGEAAAPDQSDPTIADMVLTPKTVSVYTKISRQLTQQSTPAAEALVLQDLGLLVGAAADAAALGGSGAAGEPLGVANIPGVGSFTGADLDLAAVCGAAADLAAANAVVDPAGAAWVTTPAVASLLKQRPRIASTDSRTLWQGGLYAGAIEGEKAIATTSCPSATLVFGDWTQLVVAEFSTLVLDADPFTDFRSGKIGLRALWSIDVGVRHVASFTVATGVT